MFVHYSLQSLYDGVIAFTLLHLAKVVILKTPNRGMILYHQARFIRETSAKK